MQLTMTGSHDAAGTLAVLAVLWGLGVTVFYMICAWRAMIAHEKLAVQLEELAALLRLKHQSERKSAGAA